MASDLYFIPTYNERENVDALFEEIIELGLEADILFIDDNSPDGTGELLDLIARQHSNVFVLHRPAKLGIGSAHVDAINWAYDRGYMCLVTMDCDFTHSPSHVPEFLAKSEEADVVVASRHLRKRSLETWSPYRRMLTRLGHLLTVLFLKMPYDATGAFRVYRLDRLPRTFLDAVRSQGYSFFFESLYVLHRNGYRVAEIPTDLPARVYGSSKMRLRDIVHSVSQLVHIYLAAVVDAERFEIAEPHDYEQLGPADAQGWDTYWTAKTRPTLAVYDLVAAFYRKVIIRPYLNAFIRAHFGSRSRLLHAGCGSGQVDQVVGRDHDVSALDISPSALDIYRKANKNCREVVLGSVFDIPAEDETYDGVYNLGVMEHFTEEEIEAILAEFNRVLVPGGKVVLFWPPEFGSSVIFLKMVNFLLNRVLKRDITLHPAEVTRVRSRRQIGAYLKRANLKVVEYVFGWRDLFTYVVVVGGKPVDDAQAGARDIVISPSDPAAMSVTSGRGTMNLPPASR